jgi:beta propeller domain-containing protein
MRKLARFPLASLALLALSCGDKPEDGIRDDVALQDFRSCSNLEDYIKTQALKDMNAQIDALIKGLYSGPGRGLPIPGAAAPAGTPVPALAPTQARDFTTTNTQEKDVDEGDFVKNDGSRAFVLHDRQLVKLDTWPPESTRIAWAQPLEGYPMEMFLEGDRVAVFSRVNLSPAFARAGAPLRSLPCSLTRDVRCADGLKITVLDVSGADPGVLYELYLQSGYVSSRRVGSSVRVVSTGGLRGPVLTYYLDTYSPDREALRNAYERLRSRNADIIKSSSLEDWLPPSLEVVGGRPRVLTPDCAFFHASTTLGLTTVTALNLARPDAGALLTSLLSPADEVYASKQSLYLTMRHYWRPGVQSVQEHTYIHKFDTASDSLRIRYVASGGVPGHILDQFSLSEDQGSLRVATTQRLLGTITNGVHVLQAQGGRLEQVGVVAGLAPGEQLYSSRFLDNRGYLVTYRVVDPLFTIDVSDPRQPRQVGELKVPGFSTYLHPIDRDHLLAIGRETAETPNGLRVIGLALQVFDVSDFSSPRLMHKQVFGTWGSSSEAENDHKAFNYFPARGLLAIPFSDWTQSRVGGFQSSLELFRVSLAGGIVSAGSVDHSDLNRPVAYQSYPWPYSPRVRRSIMMEDFVYSISMGGVKVSPVDDPGRTLVAISLPDPLPAVAVR